MDKGCGSGPLQVGILHLQAGTSMLPADAAAPGRKTDTCQRLEHSPQTVYVHVCFMNNEHNLDGQLSD